jgi:hypothetical protein
MKKLELIATVRGQKGLLPIGKIQSVKLTPFVGKKVKVVVKVI